MQAALAPGIEAVPAGRLKQLSARSDARGLGRLAAHVSALALTAGLLDASLGSAWVVPALVAYGVVLSFLFAAAHECIHRTAFRRRWLNDAVAAAAGFPLLLPPAYFRAFHLAHHRHTQDPARDPELETPKPRGLGEYLIHVSGLPYWWGQLRAVAGHAVGRVGAAFVPAAGRRAVVREARVYLALYAGLAIGSVAVGTWAPVVYLLLPALVGQPFLRLFLLAEHAGCAQVPDMLANTRTTTTNRLLRGLAWNMPYHGEHHLHPGVPCHALPALHACLRGRHGVLVSGYLAFHRDFIAALRRGAVAAE